MLSDTYHESDSTSIIISKMMLQFKMVDLHLFCDWLIYIHFPLFDLQGMKFTNFSPYVIKIPFWGDSNGSSRFMLWFKMANLWTIFMLKYSNVYSSTTQEVPILSCIQRPEAECMVTCIYLYFKLYFVLGIWITMIVKF